MFLARHVNSAISSGVNHVLPNSGNETSFGQEELPSRMASIKKVLQIVFRAVHDAYSHHAIEVPSDTHLSMDGNPEKTMI